MTKDTKDDKKPAPKKAPVKPKGRKSPRAK